MSVSPLSRYALSIHTSSPDLGLAIANFHDDRRQQVFEIGRDVSRQLQLKLAEFIQPQQWQDLDFIAVAIGPGGFTGTRIGVVAARTLAQQLEIPLFGISSLAAAVWQDYQQRSFQALQTVAVQMPAQRGQLHVGRYCIKSIEGVDCLIPLCPDRVLSPEDWEQELAKESEPIDRLSIAGSLSGTAASLLEIAQQQWQQGDRPHWSTVLPHYGQSPV